MHSSGETWCKNTSANSNKCPKIRNYPNCALMRVWSLSKEDNTYTLLIQRKGKRCNTYAENTRHLRRHVWKDGFSRIRGSAQSWTQKVCYHEDQYTIEVLDQSLYQDRTASWVRILNGVDKYVTESMSTKEEEDIASVKPIAKAKPR